MNIKNRRASDSSVDKMLTQTTWRTLDELIFLAKEDDIAKKLNRYREWLALWEECTRDTNDRVIVTLDGRDTAGKWSNIKKVSYDLPNPRFTVKAFGKPNAIDKYEFNHFLKYTKYFPGENWGITFFDRSWYNRAWVEAAMWFCTEEEYNWFMENVSQFEKEQIIEQWIKFIKVYLSITKSTQEERLRLRKRRIRKRHKISHIDQQAQEKWDYYTLAKAKILELTDSEHAPWTILDSNEKWDSSLEIIKAIINTSDEVSGIVRKTLELDLKPKKSVVRTAKQELARMEEEWILKKMKQWFNFRELNEVEKVELQWFRDTLDFDRDNYSYTKK